MRCRADAQRPGDAGADLDDPLARGELVQQIDYRGLERLADALEGALAIGEEVQKHLLAGALDRAPQRVELVDRVFAQRLVQLECLALGKQRGKRLAHQVVFLDGRLVRLAFQLHRRNLEFVLQAAQRDRGFALQVHLAGEPQLVFLLKQPGAGELRIDSGELDLSPQILQHLRLRYDKVGKRGVGFLAPGGLRLQEFVIGLVSRQLCLAFLKLLVGREHFLQRHDQLDLGGIAQLQRALAQSDHEFQRELLGLAELFLAEVFGLELGRSLHDRLRDFLVFLLLLQQIDALGQAPQFRLVCGRDGRTLFRRQGVQVQLQSTDLGQLLIDQQLFLERLEQAPIGRIIDFLRRRHPHLARLSRGVRAQVAQAIRTPGLQHRVKVMARLLDDVVSDLTEARLGLLPAFDKFGRGALEIALHRFPKSLPEPAQDRADGTEAAHDGFCHDIHGGPESVEERRERGH